jgi:hypothetical protein
MPIHGKGLELTRPLSENRRTHHPINFPKSDTKPRQQTVAERLHSTVLDLGLFLYVLAIAHT